jgi:predicted negative regulator of RcsB-dependent stress response
VGNYLGLVLAQAASVSGDITPLYYAAALAALLIGGLWGLKKYADKQKEEFVQRGVKEQQLSDKLEANTRANEKNTSSIEKLGEKFDTFSSAVDKRLTLDDYRIDKLEEKVNGKVSGNGNGHV